MTTHTATASNLSQAIFQIKSYNYRLVWETFLLRTSETLLFPGLGGNALARGPGHGGGGSLPMARGALICALSPDLSSHHTTRRSAAPGKHRSPAGRAEREAGGTPA